MKCNEMQRSDMRCNEMQRSDMRCNEMTVENVKNTIKHLKNA